jgi:hypothetical protein
VESRDDADATVVLTVWTVVSSMVSKQFTSKEAMGITPLYWGLTFMLFLALARLSMAPSIASLTLRTLCSSLRKASSWAFCSSWDIFLLCIWGFFCGGGGFDFEGEVHRSSPISKWSGECCLFISDGLP